MNIGASVDGPSAIAPHGSFGVKFGFNSGQRSIRLTYIFPRSSGCQRRRVPLLPVLEFLPWYPDDTNSLILAVRAVTGLRKQLFHQPVTLNDARTIIDHHSGNSPYDALLNLVAHSLIYQMFDGNVFSQMRAHLGNAVCFLMDGHSTTFTRKPFSAFSDNFLRQIVATFGPNSIRAAPACHVSEELIAVYKPLPSSPYEIPFDATFKRCLDFKMPMKQCLASDDKPPSVRICDSLACSTSSPPALPDEVALEDYDAKYFYPLVATAQGSLIEVGSLQPSLCPKLRDREENQHFIDWWRTYAYQIVTEPAKCSSEAWKTAFADRQKELHDVLACAARERFNEPQYDDSSPYLFSWLKMKCAGKINIANIAWNEQVLSFLSKIDIMIDQLQRYSNLIGDLKAVHL